MRTSVAGSVERVLTVKSLWGVRAVHAAQLLTLVVLTGPWAATGAATVIDCPLRDVPYSVDSPLIDVLLKPEARTAVDRTAPRLFAALILISFTGIVIFLVLSLVSHLILRRWHESALKQER